MNQSDSAPQYYEQTDSYLINKEGGTKGKIFEFYAKTITRLARISKLYEITPLIKNDIKNKYLLIKITKIK